MQPSTYSFPLIKKDEEASGVLSFYFDKTSAPDYDFSPGQYNRVIIPQGIDDPRGSSRMFSIASSPTHKEFLMITTKISDSPFKKYLASMPEGESLEFFGPVGRFVLDPSDARPHILLAGGIGLTPFHSMLQYAADTNIATKFLLIVSFSTREEMIYFDEMNTFSSNHPNIRVVYSLTHPDQTAENWNGERGRINSDMIAKYNPDFLDAVYFICGSQTVMKSLEEIVLQMNVKPEQIRKEQFAGY